MPRLGSSSVLVALAGVAVAAGIAVSPARAATFVVTNTNDSGAGSLRQAVLDTNTSPGADTITFAVSGTIALTSGALAVTESLELDGPGATALTVSGSDAIGILVVNSGGVRLAIEDLTLANGRAAEGGAILNNRGAISVARSVFSGNRTSSGYGGAIVNRSGSVTIADTTFTGNAALVGSAILNEGTEGGAELTITSTTFSGNTSGGGGAVSNFGVSLTSLSTVTIVNTTFADNAGGAIQNLRWARVGLTNSTLSGNTSVTAGAAINNMGDTVTIENSIFAGNSCAGFGNIDGGGNLDWPSDSGCPGVVADPELAPLADNGGPTLTMALAPGSGAIDAALAGTCPGTDQRGLARPQGDGCDIGAFESDVVDTTPPVITVPSDLAVDATSPAGAVITYVASAEDDFDGAVAVICVPPSGSTFQVGTTTVECTATDAEGNEASASFDIQVRGAQEQIEDLLALVGGIGPGSSLADKLADAAAALHTGHPSVACSELQAFANQVDALANKKLTSQQAAQLVAAAQRIRAVLAC